MPSTRSGRNGQLRLPYRTYLVTLVANGRHFRAKELSKGSCNRPGDGNRLAEQMRSPESPSAPLPELEILLVHHSYACVGPNSRIVSPRGMREPCNFRAEPFKITDTANLAASAAILGAAKFGQLTPLRAGYTPREIQFALRLQS
jgi:hypothetical protein